MKNNIKFFFQRILGFKTYLYLFSLFTIRKALSGRYEAGFSYFVKLIPNESIILDVGANIGITCIPFALAKQNAVVHAFEPITENYQTLQKVVSHYKVSNVRLYNEALGNQAGELKMIMPLKGKARQQGLSKVYISGSKEEGTIYHVPVRKLDDIYPTGNVSAIKIDVENFEYEVLSGAIKLIQRCHPIIYCELWNNQKRQDVFEMLRPEGYNFFTFDAHTETLLPLSDYNTSESNFFLIPGNYQPGKL